LPGARIGVATPVTREPMRWHAVSMPDDDERRRIGERVTRARLHHGWPKERAAAAANVSSITWTRIERGDPVRDDSLAKVLRYVEAADTGRPMSALADVPDAELLEELARRLATRPLPDGLSLHADFPDSGPMRVTVVETESEPGDAVRRHRTGHRRE